MLNQSAMIEDLSPKEFHQALNEDEFAREVLGESMLHQFFSYKMDEWDRYHQSVTDWEVQEFLRLY